MRVTVLGAGYMGSAMAKVAAMRGHDVRLWGTWLDDELLDACDRGEPHPRLKLPLADLTTMRAATLPQALDRAELVVLAVNSDGAVPVLEKAAPHLPDVPILSVSKGFLETKGRMDRIDVAIEAALGRPVRYVHAAGPAKAVEVARRVLTWMVFAGTDAAYCAEAMAGEHVHVTLTGDLAGAEVCSGLKNAYATGLGIWDGYVGKDAHNARAACFMQSIVEMRRAALAAGGTVATVDGAAGIGDLHVTAAGGRNRVFGERIGRGGRALDVAREMSAVGELTEGYMAIKSGRRFVRERGVEDTPLLDAIHAVVWEDVPVDRAFRDLRLST
jgi:glycerol-3-phosphate dehydrogenase (NAD(P)+)